MANTTLHIERIPEKDRLEAARLLAGPGADRHAAQRFLNAAGVHGVSFEHLWGLRERPEGRILAVVLLVPSAGGTFMTFTSPVETEQAAARVALLLERACPEIGTRKLAQALLEPSEKLARDAFLRAGFKFVGELLYLRRDWKPVDVSDAYPEGVSVTPWPEAPEDLAAALERSYIDTLDCPELCGLRDTADVIASHRATGRFDPALWWIVRHEGRPAGALLLNPCPAQDHTELVYLGLGPELRGRGVAGTLLRMGMSALAHRPHRTVLCAVDERNQPARKLYKREGFEEFSRRIALVRPC